MALAALAVSLTGITPADALRAGTRAVTATNAKTVDGLSASRKPEPGKLLALGPDGKFPGSVVPRVRGPRGQEGPRGPDGSPGPSGPPGTTGAEGARGPSDAYVASGPAKALPAAAHVTTTVAELKTVPPGSYVVSSVAETSDFAHGGAIVTCVIKIDGEEIDGSSAVIGNAAGSTRIGVVSVFTSVTRSDAFRASLECRVDQSLTPPPNIFHPRLSAIRVADLH